MNILEFIRNRKNNIFRIVSTILIFGTLFFTFHQYIKIEKITISFILFGIFLIIISGIFDFLRLRNRLIMASVCLVAFLILALRGYKTEFPYLYPLIYMLLVGVLSYVLSYLSDKFFPLQYIILVLIFVPLIIFMVNEIPVHKIGMAFYLTLALFFLTGRIEKHWKKQKKPSEKKYYLICVWPMIFIFLVISCVSPVSDKPYNWPLVTTLFNTITASIENANYRSQSVGREDYLNHLAGFSENGELCGEFILDDTPVISLTSNSRLNSNLYLTGVTFDTFDGRKWTSNATSNGDLNSDVIDTAETLYALTYYDKKNVSTYIKSYSFDATYQDYATSTYFFPAKLTGFSADEIDINSNLDKLNAAIAKTKYKNLKYKFSCHIMNQTADDFACFIDELSVGDIDYSTTKITRALAKYPEVSAFLPHKKIIYDDYLKEVNLSAEIQEWIADVTAGCSSDYEKLKALEAALGNLTYSNSPGELPADVDSPTSYLDYLILDKKEGFCTHYATAFTLLARALGHPARYVQGFCVPMQNSNKATVVNNMAHAWCEVYFDNIGWIAFEPTPGFHELRYTDWDNDYNNGDENYDTSSDLYADIPADSESDTKDDTTQSNGLHDFPWYIILIIIFAVIIIAALSLFIDVIITRKRIAEMSPVDRYHYDINRNFKLYAMIGLSRADSETLLEFDTRVNQKLIAMKKSTSTFIRDYEGVVYGNAPITPEMQSALINDRYLIMDKLPKRVRLWEKMISSLGISKLYRVA